MISSPVAEILRASERAGSLSKQLLAFSRPQATDPSVLNLNAVVKNAEKMLVQAIGSRIKLTKSLDPALGQVRMDQCANRTVALEFCDQRARRHQGAGRDRDQNGERLTRS